MSILKIIVVSGILANFDAHIVKGKQAMRPQRCSVKVCVTVGLYFLFLSISITYLLNNTKIIIYKTIIIIFYLTLSSKFHLFFSFFHLVLTVYHGSFWHNHNCPSFRCTVRFKFSLSSQKCYMNIFYEGHCF